MWPTQERKQVQTHPRSPSDFIQRGGVFREAKIRKVHIFYPSSHLQRHSGGGYFLALTTFFFMSKPKNSPKPNTLYPPWFIQRGDTQTIFYRHSGFFFFIVYVCNACVSFRRSELCVSRRQGLSERARVRASPLPIFFFCVPHCPSSNARLGLLLFIRFCVY